MASKGARCPIACHCRHSLRHGHDKTDQRSSIRFGRQRAGSYVTIDTRAKATGDRSADVGDRIQLR
jgi:hypothetical protein